MATSPLFGWEEPDDTDLVKDGAAAIRTLGNAIDTSMGDLLGGTSGQVLSKNSNTNMDFTWVTSDDANAIQNTIVDAKGDLIGATAADTPARLAVGTNGQVLTADSTAATGLAWATSSSGGMTLLSTTALTGASVTVSSISTSYNDLKLVFENVYSATDAVFIQTRFNADTGNKYAYQFYNTQDSGVRSGNTVGFIEVSKVRNSSGNSTSGYMLISDYNNINSVPGTMSFNYNLTHTQGGSFTYNNAAAITSVTVFMSSGNISGGTLKIYGVK